MPNDYAQLLNGNFGDLCSIFSAVYLDNVNKEITSSLVSAHIFLETKALKSELMKYLKKWFYNPFAFVRTETAN